MTNPTLTPLFLRDPSLTVRFLICSRDIKGMLMLEEASIAVFTLSTTSAWKALSNTLRKAPTNFSSAASNVDSAWIRGVRSRQPEHKGHASFGMSVFGWMAM
jgi:hypothetical protein